MEAAREEAAREEAAMEEAGMEGGGRVGSKAVSLLPKPAPAPRSNGQPPAKRSRSDEVVFLGSRAAAV